MAQAPEQSGRAPARKGGGRDNREIIRLVVFGLAFVLLIAFVVANSKEVDVHFVFFHSKISLIWVILVSALLGLLVDRLIIALGKRRKKRKP
jgi:uncharacterized integral membrane protein